MDSFVLALVKMHFFTTSIVAICIVYLSVKIKCSNRNDYDIYWERGPKFELKANAKVTNSKSQGFKSVAKAMLDLKYKHRNASLGRLILGYKDVIDKLSKIRGYKLGELKSIRFPSEMRSRYRGNRYYRSKYIDRGPKLKYGYRQKSWRKFGPSPRRIPMFLMLKDRERDVAGGGYDKPQIDNIEASSEFDTEFSPYSIARHLSSLVTHFPQANISLEMIGRTVSYNDIVMLKITEQKNLMRYFRADDSKYVEEETQEKKILFIVHGLSVMGFRQLPCLIEEKKFVKLMRMYLAHLHHYDIFMVPMANPDGVAVPHSLWNKNASPQSACSGVAVDRNFDVAWNVSKVMTSCSQQYPGTNPFSEAESRAIRDVFHKYSHKIIAYIHVHAGSFSADIFKGDAVLYPKGYTEVASEDDKYVDLKGEIDEAMKHANFQVLSVAVETLNSWYGLVHGTSVDYATSVYGVPYGMEFVMQLYTNDMFTINSEEKETNVALEEVWGRVINVTFDNIYKSLHNNDVAGGMID